MAARAKGIDWARVRSAYQRGTGPRKLAPKYGVSRQAIEQRARREGWVKPGTKVDDRRTLHAMTRALGALLEGEDRDEAARRIDMSRADLDAWIGGDEDFARLAAEMGSRGRALVPGLTPRIGIVVCAGGAGTFQAVEQLF